MAPHSSTLAWKIPGTGESGGLPVYGVAQSWTRLKWLSSSRIYHKKCSKDNHFSPILPSLFTSTISLTQIVIIVSWLISIAYFLPLCSLLLLLLSRFSRVRLCATPWMAAHQAPPSLGFSRQEHWSGLPFPSPLRESEKWKWSLSVVSDL